MAKDEHSSSRGEAGSSAGDGKGGPTPGALGPIGQGDSLLSGGDSALSRKVESAEIGLKMARLHRMDTAMRRSIERQVGWGPVVTYSDRVFRSGGDEDDMDAMEAFYDAL